MDQVGVTGLNLDRCLELARKEDPFLITYGRGAKKLFIAIPIVEGSIEDGRATATGKKDFITKIERLPEVDST